MDAKPLVVGITGNIGVGKSTVMHLLAAKGAFIIDMDQTTRRALHSAGPGYPPVVEEFGQDILRESGEIDRARLGRMVFGDPVRLAALEGILHPIVFAIAKAELAHVRAPLVAIEAIKLLEAGTTRRLCDQVWVVTAVGGGPDAETDCTTWHERGGRPPAHGTADQPGLESLAGGQGHSQLRHGTGSCCPD